MFSILRNPNARALFLADRVARLFFLVILLTNSCFPIFPSLAAAPTSPIAQVGESPVDRYGRTPEGDEARISLANGAQIIAPPGKDLMALRGDANSCLYGGTEVEVYFTCLHNGGDTIKGPHGEIWKGASPFDPVSQPNRPAESEANPPAGASISAEREDSSENRVQQKSKTTHCTTTKGYGGDYTNCDDGAQAATVHGYGGDYTAAGDGTKSMTVHGIGGAYTTEGNKKCTTTQGMAGDYTACSDGTKCTTYHGFGGDYTTCTKN